MLVRFLILILPVISLLTACSEAEAGRVDIFERSEVGYYYGRAVTSIAEGDYRKATASLGEGLEKYRNSGLYTLRGYGYCKLGKFKEAIDDFNLAFKYRQTESFSIASINRHLSKNPYFKEAFLLANRGLAYSYLEDSEKARADVDKALELEPEQSAWYCY
ncbi:MAG TPA: tetratricopeptide repeat protein, partial [Candidatus Melainabacteria bacterium]|nr:tetratricopeptide repeat protein [Candidatus Melainabacteria bacterium]